MGEPDRLIVTWHDVEVGCRAIADEYRREARHLLGVYGPPRGGCVPAAMVATMLELPILDAPLGAGLVVDDLIDSGETLRPHVENELRVAALFCKRWSPSWSRPAASNVGDAWIVMPWERDEVPVDDAALRLLQAVGMDTTAPTAATAADLLIGVARGFAAT